MFASIATIALVASASFVSAAPIVSRNETSTPSTYAEGYLESYDVYHARYLALDCQDQHNTTFFDDCCHPLLANESLSTRPSECSPNATVSASVESTIADYTSTATASATATADVEAESEYSAAASTESVSASLAEADYAHHKSHSATTTSATATATAEAKVESTTSSTEEYTPTTTSTKAAATTTASSSSDSTVYTGGYATYFYQDGVAGECGTVHSDSDYIIAIDAAGWWSDYESNDNSPYCGKSITITNTNNGKTVTATVADVCPTCDTNNSLDLSVGAFTAIASESDGMVPITWVWA